MLPILLHPITTFILGAFSAIIVIGLILSSWTPENTTKDVVEAYNIAKNKASNSGPAEDSLAETKARELFTNFLKKVGNLDYLRQNTATVYAEDAYLDDTIVTHYGPKEIQKYFEETAQTMTQFEVTIDDVTRSGPDHYFRWTMIFTAPKLGGATPIHSVGMSQVRFNANGQVAFHQDFWDSGKNIYGQIPMIGGLIHTIRNRMK